VSAESRRARKKAKVDEARQPRVAPGTRPPKDDSRTPLRAHEFTPPDPTGKIVVQLGRCDVGGPWCLPKITPDDLRTLLDRICGFESMTVREVFETGDEPGKDYVLADVPNKQAHARLVDLEYDDEDRISRLRITGKGRLYGFRREERFYALWWDPEHEIWPSKKRNT
jgi:hypothetical protein